MKQASPLHPQLLQIQIQIHMQTKIRIEIKIQTQLQIQIQIVLGWQLWIKQAPPCPSPPFHPYKLRKHCQVLILYFAFCGKMSPTRLAHTSNSFYFSVA